MEPAIIIHGGIAEPDRIIADDPDPLISAVIQGYKTLMDPSKSVVDAVEAAVVFMEDHPMFNAGIGSQIRSDGSIQMDSSIMDGKTLNAGAVAVIENVRNPVKVARAVMEKSEHVILAGSGASAFARDHGFPFYSNEKLLSVQSEIYFEDFKAQTATSPAAKRLDCDTVGAVAIDQDGNLACAVSTGSLTGCLRGRVGDACQIGQGLYCDNDAGGVVCTGQGEISTRLAFAKSVLSLMEQGCSIQDALEKVHMKAWGRLRCDFLGTIGISKNGDIGWYTSWGMLWAYIKADEIHYGMKTGEHLTKPLKFDSTEKVYQPPKEAEDLDEA